MCPLYDYRTCPFFKSPRCFRMPITQHSIVVCEIERKKLRHRIVFKYFSEVVVIRGWLYFCKFHCFQVNSGCCTSFFYVMLQRKNDLSCKLSSLHWLDSRSNFSFSYNGLYWGDLMLSIWDLIVSQKCTMQNRPNISLGGTKILLALFSSLRKNNRI